jgi:hypothetical protein
MRTRENAASLAQAVKELAIEWQQTKSSWRDIKSQEFEGKFLEELPQQAAKTAAAIEEIGAMLKKIRTDCE